MFRYLISVVFALLLSNTAFAAIDLTSPSDTWIPVLAGNNFDPGQDIQAAASVDLVGLSQDGASSIPLFYMKYDDNGTPSDSSDDTVAFRFRADQAVDSQGKFSGYIWIGVDVDLSNSIDAFMMLVGKNGANSLAVYNAGTGANTSPSTTDISSTAYPVTTNFNFNISLVSAIDSGANPDEDGDGNPDYLISYSVNFQALATALNAQTLTGTSTLIQTLNGGAGMTINTPFQLVVASAQNANTLNGDIGGYNDKVDDMTVSYADHGAFSGSLSFSDPTPNPVASGVTSLIDATPLSITADGVTTSTVTVQLKDASGNNLSNGGDTVVLSTTAGTLGTVVDNGNGTYTVLLTSATSVGTATISGTVNGAAITGTATVSFVPGIASGLISLITASPTSITADGSSTSTITVQLKDANGNNLTSGGDAVVLSTTAGTLGTVTDNHNGTYTVTLTASTSVGTATITGTINGNAISDNATVNFVQGIASALTSQITANPTSITADGSSTSTITVQIEDVAGHNLVTGGDTVVLYTSAGTLSGVTDNHNGTYTATLTSGTSATTANITGVLNGSAMTDSAAVDFTVDPTKDSDNDGIPDVIEGTVDTDNDGIPDYLDLDSDNDGIPDSVETDADSDGDGIPNYRDLDSDNDGMYDLVESGIPNYAALDANHDGRIDSNGAGDTNGLADAVETSANSGTINYTVADTDGDGVDDFRDRDSDNDGINDVIESGGSDGNNDGMLGSGTPSVDANGVPTGGPLSALDSDSDGVPNYRDLDSDNDGIYDVIEANGSDANGDGIVGPLPTVVDGNGIPLGGSLIPVDTDGDGVKDFIDRDSDNDGIPDVVEVGGSDPDGDGIIGSGMPTVNSKGIPSGGPLAPVDTDNDGIPDQRDLDADSDGISDIVEAGGTDSNHDGKVDNFTDSSGDGYDDGVAASPLPLPDSDGDGIPDFQDAQDTDGDGIPDYLDLDDDNDGIPDVDEGNGLVDTDGDGIPDSRDLDSDNDGIYDLAESGIPNASSLDANNDGRIDNNGANDTNGLADNVETTPNSGVLNYTIVDSDGDGVKDFRDIDSDNDGIPDVVENGGSDPDQDGRIGTSPVPVNTFGVAVGTTGITKDTDQDGIPDYLDIDADNDGVMDIVEVGGTDSNNDGKVDNFTDNNGDGYDDTIEAAPLTVSDNNHNGTADYLEPKQSGEIKTGLQGVGGCSVVRNAPFDPVLPSLFLVSLLVAARKRIRNVLLGRKE